MLYDRARWVTRSYAARVEQVFEAHATRPGPSSVRAVAPRNSATIRQPATTRTGTPTRNNAPEETTAAAAKAEKAEGTAARRIEMLALTLDGHNAATVADRFGSYSEEVGRTLRRLGIYVRGEGSFRTVSAIVSPALAAQIRDAWHRVDVDHDNPLDVWADLLAWSAEWKRQAFLAWCTSLTLAGSAPVAADEPDWAEAA